MIMFLYKIKNTVLTYYHKAFNKRSVLNTLILWIATLQ